MISAMKLTSDSLQELHKEDTATCLDIIAIDKAILCLHYEVGTLFISDHLPVRASINFKGRRTLEPVIKRSWRNVNWDSVRSRAAMVQLKDSAVHSIDEILSGWHSAIIEIIDDVAPLKAFPWRKDRSPWI